MSTNKIHPSTNPPVEASESEDPENSTFFDECSSMTDILLNELNEIADEALKVVCQYLSVSDMKGLCRQEPCSLEQSSHKIRVVMFSDSEEPNKVNGTNKRKPTRNGDGETKIGREASDNHRKLRVVRNSTNRLKPRFC
ncbi:unnamed protein product [Caenorhabditis nigoni]